MICVVQKKKQGCHDASVHEPQLTTSIHYVCVLIEAMVCTKILNAFKDSQASSSFYSALTLKTVCWGTETSLLFSQKFKLYAYSEIN